MKYILIIASYISLPTMALSQDSLLVYQKEATFFSNKYIFYTDGTFKHYFFTDDLQVWFGKGKYTDKGKIRTLKFGDPEMKNELNGWIIHYEANFTRKLKISGNMFISLDYYHSTRKKYVSFVPQ
jgi:hypothetical protein